MSMIYLAIDKQFSTSWRDTIEAFHLTSIIPSVSHYFLKLQSREIDSRRTGFSNDLSFRLLSDQHASVVCED